MTEGSPATRAAGRDGALVARAQQGERAALDELYRRHRDYVYTLCFNLCGDREDAQDLLQETFVHAWRGLPKFAGRSSFTTWLYRIAVNVAHDARRRHREPMPTDRNPAADAETIDHVRAALARLRPAHRAVLVLRYSLSLSHQEIAECLHWSLSRAKVTAHRAKRAFKDEYLRLAGRDEIEK
ncbi:MAG: RNA polymerase sigma factor [Armatimonadota bacterium]|nr:MAG: RNA polymerase sigma factor [Armatimonadota bacterium]